MTPRETFKAEAAKRILITDGAFGTEIQNWKLSEADYAGSLTLGHDQKGNNDILALTKPEVPESIHRAYFEAGADIAETYTFSANRISQADYGAEHLVREINVESAKLARRIADEFAAKDGRPRFVAGAIGPTNKTLSVSPYVNDPGYRAVTFDEVKGVYREQIDGKYWFPTYTVANDTLHFQTGDQPGGGAALCHFRGPGARRGRRAGRESAGDGCPSGRRRRSGRKARTPNRA